MENYIEAQKCCWLCCYLKRPDVRAVTGCDSLSFTDKMNDYAIPGNVSFLKFSETCHDNLENQDKYSWNDAKKVLATPVTHRRVAGAVSVFQMTKCEGCHRIHCFVSLTIWMITQCQITHHSWNSRKSDLSVWTPPPSEKISPVASVYFPMTNARLHENNRQSP